VVVGKQEIKKTGQKPIAFSMPLDMSLLVPTNDATLYATLVDGVNAWTTDGGIKVATNGNPTTDVQVPLVFRPDLIQGEVTGAITGLPSDIGLDAWAMAFILDQSDGTVLGVQTGAIIGSTFVPFSVPFLVENIDPSKTYVAGATVFDNERTFRSEAGVPVITNRVFSAVELPVILAGPTPTPSPAATPTAAASASAAPSAAATATAHPVATASPATSSGSGSGGIDPLVLAGVAGLAIIGLIVVAVIVRR
jgi:uncharacterized lipoprotein YbaY